jgi:GMP synthase-like glutamine amidotransferase
MKVRLALLNMYNGIPNLGMQNIRDILSIYPELEIKEFDVRARCELPGMDYDIYICTGGPGSPLEGDGVWDRAFFHLMDRLWNHNQGYEKKKYVFFICHSYQMICHYLSLGSVIYRRKESFGVFPVHLTEEGKKEPYFKGLSSPFYAADFRMWQLIQPNLERIKRLNCKILAMEKIRPHIPLERAIMAMRFSNEWFGVQFHPEADPDGMFYHFDTSEKKEMAIAKKGEGKYKKMIEHIKDPNRLLRTYDTILPSFMVDAIAKVKQQAETEIQ